MKKKHTKLLDAVINPIILELMKTPLSKIRINSNISFEIERKGRYFHITIYSGKEGQINIWTTDDNGMLGRVIIQDYCKSLEDFSKLLVTLDELIDRMPMDTIK